MSGCYVKISSIDAARHFGDWSCSFYDDFTDKSISSKIIVVNQNQKVGPAKVEFVKYYGEATIDVVTQEEVPLKCEVKPQNRKDPPFLNPPGEMSVILSVLSS